MESLKREAGSTDAAEEEEAEEKAKKAEAFFRLSSKFETLNTLSDRGQAAVTCGSCRPFFQKTRKHKC